MRVRVYKLWNRQGEERSGEGFGPVHNRNGGEICLLHDRNARKFVDACGNSASKDAPQAQVTLHALTRVRAHDRATQRMS